MALTIARTISSRGDMSGSSVATYSACPPDGRGERYPNRTVALPLSNMSSIMGDGMAAELAPQPVEILPDQAGWLHRLRVLPDGTREALVSWVDVGTGFNGRLVDHIPEWLPEARVRHIPGTDYTAIEAAAKHVEAAAVEEHVAARPAPRGWPPQVLPPDEPNWVTSATSWLLDLLPPDYRAHTEIVTMPRVLAWMAATHVDHHQEATQREYRSAATDLRGRETPEVIQQVLDVYQAEKERLATVRESIRAVRRALAAQSH